MIKPSAIVTVGPHDHGPFHFRDTPHGCDTLPDGDTNLYTLADVLAALRQPSEAMIEAGDKKYEGTLIVEEAFLAMLDAFEKEQSSPAKKAYEAANPLGGPARMFEAIAERIRSGEEYYAVLKDYGVTVEAK